ncbi:MAG: hypothetical protein JO061_05625 [Acidobacteriaceae bacterium]|nr:hypothetical protein [Acidobacteriaceae bacterium]
MLTAFGWRSARAAREPDDDLEARSGLHRLLRAGFVLLGSAIVLWVASLGFVKAFVKGHSDPIAQVIVLTATVLLWPFATIGLLLLLAWAIIRIAVH